MAQDPPKPHLSEDSLVFVHVGSGAEVHQANDGNWLVVRTDTVEMQSFSDLYDATLYCEQLARERVKKK